MQLRDKRKATMVTGKWALTIGKAFDKLFSESASAFSPLSEKTGIKI